MTSFTIKGIGEVKSRFNAINSKLKKDEVYKIIAPKIKAQTKKRLLYGKKDPDGRRWADWSKGYLKTRTASQSKLLGTKALLNSININREGDKIYIISNIEYANTHQYGDHERNIPQRAYVGINAQNISELDIAIKRHVKA